MQAIQLLTMASKRNITNHYDTAIMSAELQMCLFSDTLIMCGKIAILFSLLSYHMC